MDEITLEISLEDIEDIDEAELYKILSEAVEESLEVARDALAASVRDANLADYIQSRPVILTDPFHGMIIIDDARAETMLAAQEYGSPAWDMKPYLLNSPKAKLSKTGTPYIIVPFHSRYGYNPLNPSASKFNYAYNQAGVNKSFKTVTPNSSGWIYPARPADPVFENAKQEGHDHLLDSIENILE